MDTWVAATAITVGLELEDALDTDYDGAEENDGDGNDDPYDCNGPTMENAQELENSSTLRPGPYAKESIPARSPERDFAKQERDKINETG